VSQPPVTLAEVRSHLNFDESDGHDFDEELWQTTLEATEICEAEFGPIRPRSQTSAVRVNTDGTLLLPVRPVLSVQSVTDFYGAVINVAGLTLDPTGTVWAVGGIGWSPQHTVVYTVGYDPIPTPLMKAVKLQAGLIWSSQRGPESSSRFSAIGGDGFAPGGMDWARLQQIFTTHGLRLGFG
jgi:hypothetical protein